MLVGALFGVVYYYFGHDFFVSLRKMLDQSERTE